MIRLVATDLDGTLLEPNGRLPEGTFDVIRELRQAGIYVAAASGRQYGNLRRLFAPVADQMAFLCENGAICVVDDTEIITPIPAELVQEALSDLESLGMNILISGKHTCYVFDRCRKYTDDIVYRLRNTVTVVDSLADIEEPVLKISGQLDAGAQQVAPYLLKRWSHRLTAAVAGRDWFDLTLANKGSGIQRLMEAMKLTRDEVAAFGDNFNDEPMLDSVGYPFIMAHAATALHKPEYRSVQKVLPVMKAMAQRKASFLP